MKEPVTFLFQDPMVLVTLVNRGRFAQLIFESNRRNNETDFVNITRPTIFEVTIFFYCMSVFNDGFKKKTLTVPQAYPARRLRSFHSDAFVHEIGQQLSVNSRCL